MKRLCILVVALLVSGVYAEEASSQVELPEEASAPATEVTTNSSAERLQNIENMLSTLYEKIFKVEARVLRIETLLKTLSGNEHLHQWRLTSPQIVNNDTNPPTAAAICSCGEFRYVPITLVQPKKAP